MPRKNRKLGGGLFDNWGQTFSNFYSQAFNKKPSYSSSYSNPTTYSSSLYTSPSSSYTSPSSSYTSQSSSYTSPSSFSSTSYSNPTSFSSPSLNSNSSFSSRYGGTKRKYKYKKGGYKDNTSVTDLASKAAPFSGKTAGAHNYVGGKTYRRKTNKKTKKNYKKYR